MLIKLYVKHVLRDPISSRHMMILQSGDEGNHYLKISVGDREAEAVEHWLKSIIPPRPMTYDMISSIINLSDGVDISRIIIDSCDECGVFYAKLVLSVNGNEKIIDCRPSDAVAVGIRLNVPIFADTCVMDKHGILF